jgi:biopolymer transport protein ExbD
MEFFIKRPRREPFALQLTAMIDIFSMIVIFLIMGTVFGSSDFIFPADFILPQSASKENSEPAPQLIITQDSVEFKPLQLKIPLKDFVTDPDGAGIKDFSRTLRSYAGKLPESAKTSGNLLNVMTDERVAYEQAFEVLKVFRQAGFDTLLFVTTPRNVSSQ